MRYKNNQLSRPVKTVGIIAILTILVAFFCDIKTINTFLVSSASSDEETSGPMALLYLFSVVGIFVMSVRHRAGRIAHIPAAALFILLSVSVLYLFTMFFVGVPYTSVLFFGVFTIASFLIPFVAQIDARLFLKALMLFAVPAVFQLDRIFRFINDYSDKITMGLSYAFLTPILAAIVYMFLYSRHEHGWSRVLTIIGLGANLIFAYYLASYGSRGPMFAIIALVTFLLIVQPSPKGYGIKLRRGRMWILFGIIVLTISAFLPVLLSLQEVLSEQDLTFNFINKFISMSESGDITNGRQIILEVAINDIKNSLFFGYGLDGFAKQHISMAAYPHNFIIQTLYDGGLFLFFILFVPLMRGGIRIFRTCTLDEYAVYTALIFGSIPPALFSGDLWRNGNIWLLFGALLSASFVKKANENNYKTNILNS